MRVYELAKKLGMENRELIPELKRLGIPWRLTAAHWMKIPFDIVLEKRESESAVTVKPSGSLGTMSRKEKSRSPKDSGTAHLRKGACSS